MRICHANLLQQQVPSPRSSTASTTRSTDHQLHQESAQSSYSKNLQGVALMGQVAAPAMLTNHEHKDRGDLFLPALIASRNATASIIKDTVPEMILQSALHSQQANNKNELVRKAILLHQEEERTRVPATSILRPAMSIAASGHYNCGHPSQEMEFNALHRMHTTDMQYRTILRNSHQEELLKMHQIRSTMLNHPSTPFHYLESITNQQLARNYSVTLPTRYVGEGVITSRTISHATPQLNRSLLAHDILRQINTAITNASVDNVQPSTIHLSLPSCVSRPIDFYKLSAHQCLLREQIEYFEATDKDVIVHIRGRNKAITVGQVGIRCKHCAHLPISKRQKGSTYYPSCKMGIYQAAQNMSSTHLQCGLCSFTPDRIKDEFATIMADRQRNENGAGRPYWAESATQSGLIDTEEHGIRFVHGTSLPLLGTSGSIHVSGNPPTHLHK